MPKVQHPIYGVVTREQIASSERKQKFLRRAAKAASISAIRGAMLPVSLWIGTTTDSQGTVSICSTRRAAIGESASVILDRAAPYYGFRALLLRRSVKLSMPGQKTNPGSTLDACAQMIGSGTP